MKAIGYCLILMLVVSFPSQSQQLNVDSLRRELKRSGEDTNKVNLYRMLCGTLRQSDPLAAIEYGIQGVELGKKLKFDKGIAGCYLNISVCYTSAARLDSSARYLDSAIIYARIVGEPNRLALAYLNRADVHRQLRNFNQALKDCDTSYKYAEQVNSDDRRARVLQTIGSIYYHQDQYDKCAEYYNRAYEMYVRTGNKQMSAIILNNLGNVHKNQGNYSQAITSLKQAVSIADSINDLSNLSMYHGNISDLYLLVGNISLAEQAAATSMQYAVQLRNEFQMAVAHAHFAEIYLKQKKYSQALEAGTQAYNISRKEDDLPLQHSSADVLAEAYAATGSYNDAYRFMRISKELGDSLNRQQYDEEVASLQTRFEVNEKNSQIQLLEKDRLLQKKQLEQQRAYLFGFGAVVLLVIAGTAFLISRSRLRQRMKELELRNRIAADLHDEVGSSLSSIHMLSQVATQRHTVDAVQDDILTRVSTNARETMEKMSDIVWMIKPREQEGQGLIQRMKRFLFEICSSRNIEAAMHGEEVLERLKFTMQQRKNIYLIFKEAVNNAVKYSDTEKLDVSMEVKNHKFIMTVEDYGKGFDSSSTGNGNGLSNMRNRAKESGGNLSIDSSAGSGTRVVLQVAI